jgi:hypothetical protein
MHSSQEDPIRQEDVEPVRPSVDVVSQQVRVKVGARGAVVRLRCPRCGLAMSARSRWIAAEHCPRCVARARKLVVLLHESEAPDPSALPFILEVAQRTEGAP